jgi:hypothetical protein
MFSISINNEIISEVKFIDIELLKCHEQVVLERKESLVSYLKSLNPEILISSLIVCDQTNMIIDGHHRYSAMKELGINIVPVTYVKYQSDFIKTHVDNRISKDEILHASLTNQLLEPKSSKHLIYDNDSKTWKPIILISTLFCLKF